jgi:thiamine-phosphate diphosphorylase
MAIKGGADTIQFRQKVGATREMIEIVRQLKQLCLDSGVTLVVNDRVDVAIAADADGVHLGQNDFPITLARKLLGESRSIGGSAATLEEAQKCLTEGVDYIGFGPVYPTTSKADAGPVTGIKLLKQTVEAISLPIVAIGGISVENTPEVIRAGARGIAVISAVCCHKDPEQATRSLRQALQTETLRGNHA